MCHMPLFDTHVVVDWSARSTPSPSKPHKDSIWWAAADAETGKARTPEYARTRCDAVERLAILVAGELDEGRRVLVGFDFPFGYPKGVAERLTGRASGRELWAWLTHRIEDAKDNANNRYEVAAKINRKYPGAGPFWGRPPQWNSLTGVPIRARERTRRERHPPERRIADRRAKGAKTVWQLAYAGSVGSQVLLGLPAIERLIAVTRHLDLDSSESWDRPGSAGIGRDISHLRGMRTRARIPGAPPESGFLSRARNPRGQENLSRCRRRDDDCDGERARADAVAGHDGDLVGAGIRGAGIGRPGERHRPLVGVRRGADGRRGARASRPPSSVPCR